MIEPSDAILAEEAADQEHLEVLEAEDQEDQEDQEGQVGQEGSVAAAPANCWLKPEPEPAPIRAEPSRIWSSRHFLLFVTLQLHASKRTSFRHSTQFAQIALVQNVPRCC